MKLEKTKCDIIITECDKHIKRMNSASEKIQYLMPLNVDGYNSLTEDDITYFDQLFFRFSKLQDAIGEKFFPAILLFLKEKNITSKPFIDILNRLEKLNLLDDKNQWLKLREIRNELSHEYDDNAPGMTAAINHVFENKNILIDIYLKIQNFYSERTKDK